MLSKSIGKNIKQFRTAKGISQEDLASDLFVTRQTISNYETGRSFPDVDMLQKIAIALDVDLLWLLYGRPASHDKKANAKTALFFVGFFVAFSCVTLLLYLYTESLKQSKFLFMPNIIVRLIFVPVCYTLLGASILQIIDYFLGITKPQKKAKKIGGTVIICVLVFNIIIVMPYVIWCFFVLFLNMTSADSISMIFPPIPIYEEIALFFLKLMYSSPFVYISVGMTLWLFYPPKKG